MMRKSKAVVVVNSQGQKKVRKVVWDVKVAIYATNPRQVNAGDLDGLLRDGWEPFSVVARHSYPAEVFLRKKRYVMTDG